MPSHPIASFIARLWPGTRAPAGPDAADLGTAFGLDLSLQDADDGQASRVLGSAAHADSEPADTRPRRLSER